MKLSEGLKRMARPNLNYDPAGLVVEGPAAGHAGIEPHCFNPQKRDNQQNTLTSMG
jgi:hypothetical protein